METLRIEIPPLFGFRYLDRNGCLRLVTPNGSFPDAPIVSPISSGNFSPVAEMVVPPHPKRRCLRMPLLPRGERTRLNPCRWFSIRGEGVSSIRERIEDAQLVSTV